jgi:hypothetical protein
MPSAVTAHYRISPNAKGWNIIPIRYLALTHEMMQKLMWMKLVHEQKPFTLAQPSDEEQMRDVYVQYIKLIEQQRNMAITFDPITIDNNDMPETWNADYKFRVVWGNDLVVASITLGYTYIPVYFMKPIRIVHCLDAPINIDKTCDIVCYQIEDSHKRVLRDMVEDAGEPLSQRMKF